MILKPPEGSMTFLRRWARIPRDWKLGYTFYNWSFSLPPNKNTPASSKISGTENEGILTYVSAVCVYGLRESTTP